MKMTSKTPVCVKNELFAVRLVKVLVLPLSLLVTAPALLPPNQAIAGYSKADDDSDRALANVSRASRRAERGIRNCGVKFAGQTAALNDCVAGKLEKLAKRIETKGADAVVPRAVPVIRQAARALRKAHSKKAAGAVLNKARSVLRSLAAANSGDAKRAYNRVSRVFAVAINVINNKG